MAHLDITLLGTAHVRYDQQPISIGAHAKTLGLLAYLAVESDRLHQRARLADLFWPEQQEERGRHSLRQALSTLRRAIDVDAKPPHLLISRDSISFNRASDYTLDAEAFDALLRTVDVHDHLALESCPPCIGRLETAVTMYHGDFLAGFSPGDSLGFEEWSQNQRQRFHQQVLGALTAIGAFHAERGAPDRAIAAIRRQLELEPWQESAHRRLMELLWRAGRRSQAVAQYDRCRELLENELGVEPEEETTELYRRIRSSRSAANDGSSPTRRDTRGRLPIPPTRLVGRVLELAEIADMVTHRDCRMVTLIGPGGSGKTRLAIQTAEDQQSSFPNGAWFVSLEHIHHGDGIVSAVANEIGLALSGGDDPEQQLLEWLRSRSILLVLDNAEHLVESLSLVPRLLASSRTSKIIITSRERLWLRGEWVYDVGGLAVPETWAPDTRDRYGAVQLLADRLAQVGTGAKASTSEQEAAVRICRLVDGMPLAIELAAGWAQSLPLEQIADGIRQNLDFLSTQLRDVPTRHKSMRAIFNQSWSMLSDDEQAGYRRLSVFRDGFSVEAAEHVAELSAEVLAALVSKSLMTRDQSGRYRLHSLLRQYGEELLREDNAAFQLLLDRHSAYYLELLGATQDELTGRNQHAAFSKLEADMEKMRFAWNLAAERGNAANIDAAAQAMWLTCVAHGWMREGAELFGRACEALEAEGPERGQSQPAFEVARAKVMVRFGGFRSGLGQYDEGIGWLRDGIAVLRQHEMSWELGLALNMLAAAYRMKGNDKEARALFQESLDQFRLTDDLWGVAFSLNDLGLVSYQLGNRSEATRFCEESRTMFRRIGDRRGQAFAAYSLGVIAARDGDFTRANRLHHEALTLREEMDDRWGVAASLVQLGFVARSVGSSQDATIRVKRALDIAWNSSVTPVVLDALVEHAAIALEGDDVERVKEILTAVCRHPAVQGQTLKRVTHMMRDLDLTATTTAQGAQEARWAVQAVNDLARSLVGA